MTEGLAEAAQPSTDELRSFDIGLRDGLIDTKHMQNMGMAIWLYMWLVRRVTKIDNGLGVVLGGKPVNYSDVCANLQIDHMRYRRYLDTLREHDYITTKRTPRGFVVTITKGKKSFYLGEKREYKYVPSNIREGKENNTYTVVTP